MMARNDGDKIIRQTRISGMNRMAIAGRREKQISHLAANVAAMLYAGAGEATMRPAFRGERIPRARKRRRFDQLIRARIICAVMISAAN